MKMLQFTKRRLAGVFGCFCLSVVVMPIGTGWRYPVILAILGVLALVVASTRGDERYTGATEKGGILRQLSAQFSDAILVVLLMGVGLGLVAGGFWLGNILAFLGIYYAVARDHVVFGVGSWISKTQRTGSRTDTPNTVRLVISNLVQFAPLLLGIALANYADQVGFPRAVVVNIGLFIAGLDLLYLLVTGVRLVDKVLGITVTQTSRIRSES